ncbi:MULTISPECIES: cysteine rich repeat-containing protein [Bradyrhizobium]|uniref:cysteine rich repeat-containing protein n=1 Tax=Bradyrhizobium TaxID=374 RepID=UPI0015566F02|nr:MULTISPECIES: cysteine rich repeat-containing protein [Bradyrhizobium]NPV21610.1 hypothetical protein [Bradyrhizobium aeschynomenes]
MKTLFTLALGIAVMTAASAYAQGTGPVATQCAADIQSLCSGKQHGQGQVRACLDTHRDKVSADCRAALDTTGGGQGKGPRR